MIDPAGCIDCGICANICPVQCISLDAVYEHDPVELAAAKQQAKDWARRRYERDKAARAAVLEIVRRLNPSLAAQP